MTKKILNLLTEKDLLALDGANFYDPPVTDADLWLAVGRALQARREAIGYSSPKALQQARRDAQNERTMRSIEAGRPGNVTGLSDYCQILDLSLTDVIASVLPGVNLSAGAMRVARAFDLSSLKMQRAVRAVLDIEETPPTPPESATPHDAGKQARGKKPSRSGRGR